MGNCRSTSIPPLLNPNTNEISVGEKEKADLLNSYFCNISTSSDDGVTPPDLPLRTQHSLDIDEITEDEIKDILKSLEIGKASGEDCQKVQLSYPKVDDLVGIIKDKGDDFGGADTVNKDDEVYNALGALLESCGLEESKQKGVAPTTRMEFLLITVETLKLTLEVTSDRVQEISLLVQAWLRKKEASLRELQSLLGKFHFVSTCVRPGRICGSRLLNWLRSAFPSNVVGRGQKIFRRIPVEVQKDLLW
ncbi:unnamed protein product [Mytilus coruscus]|uniref:Uncharacterized protein n=1 Tax=Mytilus coruscus TaxID=42192 RepID=A0A6J8AYI3_MYTCO|nr:unnamed protein product [Mytilus coruscus]